MGRPSLTTNENSHKLGFLARRERKENPKHGLSKNQYHLSRAAVGERPGNGRNRVVMEFAGQSTEGQNAKCILRDILGVEIGEADKGVGCKPVDGVQVFFVGLRGKKAFA